MHIQISNLGQQITEESLSAAFSAFGSVSTAEVMMDAFTGRSRGFGFVEMNDESEAATAIAKINGSILDGHTVSVAESKAPVKHLGSYPVGKKAAR